MNKRNVIIALIVLLAIGFAAVTTTLYINGTISFKSDEDGFDVYFSDAVVEDNLACADNSYEAVDISAFNEDLYSIGLPGKIDVENDPSINILTNTIQNMSLKLLDEGGGYGGYNYCDENQLGDYTIGEDGKTLSFYTGELKEVGNSSILHYQIYNNSTQYDADVKMSCTVEENNYVTVSNSIDSIILEAKASATGELEVVLNRVVDEPTSIAINCEIDATATERESLSEEKEGVTEDGESILYGLYGRIAPSVDIKDESELLKDYTVVIYPEALYATPDENGEFYIEDVKGGGKHTIYYIEGKNVDNIANLTEEEIADLSLSKAVFQANYINYNSIYYNYDKHYIYLENDYVLQGYIYETERYNITFNANGGSVGVTSLNVASGYMGDFPTPTREGYIFDGWHYSLESYDEVSKYDFISSDITVYAQWKKCETNDSGIEMCWNDVNNSETKTVGDTVSLAGENFYIYSVSDTEFQLMTMYAVATSAFSNATYCGENKNDYAGSLAEKHVNDYSEYLQNDLGIPNTARLISKEELDAMAGKTLADYDSLEDLGLPAFLYGDIDNDRYWTSSAAEGTDYVWTVYSIPNKIMSIEVYNIRGIRPVITISADLLN